jgi:two-component system response regulator HydG
VREGPFVVIDCAATDQVQLEEELFGCAATSDRQARAGALLEAQGGTLFLDSIGELSSGLQGKLLRVVQSQRVRPFASANEVQLRVRLVSATHRDLDSRVAEGAFREDLFYRIAVLPLRMPPLRERGSDVLVLANEFVRRIGERMGKRVEGIAPETARKLVAYSWPGNVRELANAMERAVALAELDVVSVVDLPEKIQAFVPAHVLVAGDDPSELVSLDEVERRYILRVVEAVGGNRSRAAEILKVDRKTLYSKLKAYGPRGSEAP